MYSQFMMHGQKNIKVYVIFLVSISSAFKHTEF